MRAEQNLASLNTLTGNPHPGRATEQTISAGGISIVSLADAWVDAVPEHFLEPAPAPFAKAQRPSSFILLLITQGAMKLQVDFQSKTLREGTLTLIHPGQLLVWSAQKAAGLAGFMILLRPDALSPEVMAELPPPYDEHQSWKISPALMQIFTGQFQELSKVSPASSEARPTRHLTPEVSPQQVRALLLKHHVSALVVQLALLTERGSHLPSHSDGAFQGFQALVETHFASRHHLSWYSQTLGLSPRTLRTLCQRAVAQSPKQILEQRLFLEAERYLSHSRTAVKDIATALGFKDSSNFASFFKKHQGHSPRAFREAHQLTKIAPGA